MNAFEYVDSHRDEFLNELQEFLRIPSISTLPEHAGDIKRAAEWVANQLRRIGMTKVNVYPTPGHPIVYGEWLGAPNAPTVLVYGHYDVQPVDPINEWHTGPFEPTIRDGKLYARGSSDDKGQVFIHLKVIQALMQTNGSKLPVNVKFLIEGEEEYGSQNLDNFLLSHQDLLRADVTVISDGSILAPDRPSISYALRGMVYLEIEVKGPSKDLHSGSYGGTVHNPAQALCEIVAALHNPDNSVAVPGFYDKVRPIDTAERAALAQNPLSEDEWQRQTGAPRSWGEAAYSLVERIGARPTLEVNGLIGGFTGVGSKTVLPAKALAKVSCRLVPDQDPFEVEKLVRAYVEKITPPDIISEVRRINDAYPAIVPITSPAMDAARKAYEKGWGAAPVFTREGGTLPIVATLQRLFNAPVLLMGYGLHDDGAHGPNEKFNLDCFDKGLATSITLYEELGKIPAGQLQ
ncbi:MAG: dipeptidase [Anaerolineae bacterium]|nr:dipeptidase [Anaerolineae bacterium]